MATYTIIVNNQAVTRFEFLLFNALPTLPPTGGTAYSNVWVKSPSVNPPNGEATFVITAEQFAVCGTAPQRLDNGVIVSTGDFTPVTLAGTVPGTKAIVEVVDGGPGFSQPAEPETLASSFGIFVAHYNAEEYENIYVGYGKYDNNKKVVPVSVWSAAPNTTYSITPNNTYYVATGTFQQGTTVDVTTLGAYSTIDFTTAPQPGMTVATITLTVEGEYTAPEFSFPPNSAQ